MYVLGKKNTINDGNNFNTKEIRQMAKIFNKETLCLIGYKLLNLICISTRYDKIIYIDQHKNDEMHMFENKKRGIS